MAARAKMTWNAMGLMNAKINLSTPYRLC